MTEAPYGYTYLPRTDSCPGKLVINEAEAEVVRQIFRWLVDEQLSTYQINKRLNENGTRTRHGKPRWAGGFLVNLLRNPVYTGTYYYNKRRQVKAQRKNMPATRPTRHHSSRGWRDKEEWIPVPVPAIIDLETWELARQQLQLNRERAPRNNKQHDYLLKSLLVCTHCNLRMIGNAGTKRNRRYMCSRKESLRVHSEPCRGRTVLAQTIEELVWHHVSELLRHPELLLEQYQLRQDQRYGTPEQQEQLRLERKLSALGREEQRLIDAYQAEVIELSDLKERCARITEHRTQLAARLSSLKQQQQDQRRQTQVRATLEEFCCNMSTALQNPSLETKQRILRQVVEKVVVADEQMTIKHMIPISDVGLRRHQHSPETPKHTPHASPSRVEHAPHP